MLQMHTFVNLSPYMFMASKLFSVLYTYSYIAKKQRIILPRCDNYEVHYVPGVPENSKFNCVYFCPSRSEMDWVGSLSF